MFTCGENLSVVGTKRENHQQLVFKHPKLIKARIEQRFLCQARANRWPTLAQTADSFNQIEGRNASQYSTLILVVYRAVLPQISSNTTVIRYLVFYYWEVR